MSERNADFYQKTKDDEAEWGDEVPSPRMSRRRLDAIVSVRFSPDEEVTLREEATRRGESLSAYIRRAALQQSGISGRPGNVTWRSLSSGSEFGGTVLPWGGVRTSPESRAAIPGVGVAASAQVELLRS